MGSTVDARKGEVVLTSIAAAGAPPQSARFYDGMFKVTQSGSTTDLTLNEPLAPCSSKKARAAAKKPKSRKLWGDGKGKFRTRGQYGAATIRGTKWLVQDSCAGTLIKVDQGVVSVEDYAQAQDGHRAGEEELYREAPAPLSERNTSSGVCQRTTMSSAPTPAR